MCRDRDRRLALALLCVALAALLCPADAARSLHQITDAASPLLNQTDWYQAGCGANFTLNQWKPHHPGYHVLAPYGWINDPVGMFQAPTGRHHLFFQYNPKAVQWQPPFWGHVASDDLAHWTWLPPALLPDKLYDQGGCWSGGTTVTTEGVPILTYTGAGTDVPQAGNRWQTQCAAVPADPADPWLKYWIKPETNPFLSQVAPGSNNFQFRDPTEGRHGVWLALTSSNNPYRLANGSYAMVIGGQAFGYGNAAMYVAPNMTGPWRYVGNLYNQLAIEPEILGQCAAGGPSKAPGYQGPAYGGPYDQFGAACRAWEVVDILELTPGLFVVKWCDQSRYRANYAQEWYSLSNGGWNYNALVPPMEGDPVGMYAMPGDNNTALQAMGAAMAQMQSAMEQLAGQGQSSEEFGRQLSNYADAREAQNMTTYGPETAYNYVNASDESSEQVLFTAKLNGQKYYPQVMDYGSIYASMVFRTNDSRQVMYTWAFETAAGCADQCSGQMTELTNITNFKGVLNLPRLLTYDEATQTMRVYPVKEVELLRTEQIYANESVMLPDLPGTVVLVPEGTIDDPMNTTARQMEVQLWFNLTAGDAASAGDGDGGNASAGQPFKVGARILTGNNTYFDCFINGTVGMANGSTDGGDMGPAITEMGIFVDRSMNGGYSNTTFVEGGPVPTPVNGGWALSDGKVWLSVWIDHSMIEVYAQGGLGRVTSRVYPSDDTSDWGVAAFGDVNGGGMAEMDGAIWSLENAWLPPNCD